MWLVGITEPKFSPKTKFHLFDFKTNKIKTVDGRTFILGRLPITNVKIGKSVELLSGAISELPVFVNGKSISNNNMTILYKVTDNGILDHFVVMNGVGAIGKMSYNKVKEALSGGTVFVNAKLISGRVVPKSDTFGFVIADSASSVDYSYDLRYLLSSVMEQAKAAGIPISETISKAVKVVTGFIEYGCCEKDKISNWYQISINRKYLTDSWQIRNIFAHELIHTCRGCNIHNERFKQYAKIMSDKYGYTMERCNDATEKSTLTENKVKYIKCRMCGHIMRDNSPSVSIENRVCHCCKRVGTMYRAS